jgi:hypothetical protein
MLTRKNTVNGLLYKDDPAILGWNIFNEMRCRASQMPPGEWVCLATQRAPIFGKTFQGTRNQETNEEFAFATRSSAFSAS